MADEQADSEWTLIDAWWRAANYLSVSQIYLYANPLLKETLTKEHIKLRLLGHWGTTPGLNFVYAHLDRVISRCDLDMIYVTGPGYGRPALVANAYLEGTYSEVHPNVSQDEEGMKRLFKQFSFLGGIPSHVAPEIKDLAERFLERFRNVTNGVTQRRWLLLANPVLARTISAAVGDGWISDLSELRKLGPLVGDPQFHEQL